MRNNCNKHRGKITGRNGWCNDACAVASRSPRAVCVLFCNSSQSNDTVLEKLLGILSNAFKTV